MHRITFNESCLSWTNDVERNNFFLIHNLFYLNEKFTAQGYLYLNDIYETLGAAWNPDWENICYRSKSGFSYEVQHIEDTDFWVIIHG